MHERVGAVANYSNFSDDPTPVSAALRACVVSGPLLDRSEERDGMERLYDGARAIRQHADQTHARGARTHAARRTHRCAIIVSYWVFFDYHLLF